MDAKNILKSTFQLSNNNNQANQQFYQKIIQIQKGFFKLAYGNDIMQIRFQPKETNRYIYQGFYTNDNLPSMVVSMFQTAQNLFHSLKSLEQNVFQFIQQQLNITINPSFNLKMKIKIELPLQKHIFTQQQILQRKIQELFQQNKKLLEELKQKQSLKQTIKKQAKQIQQLKAINQHYIQLKNQSNQEVVKLQKKISTYSTKEQQLNQLLSKKQDEIVRHKSQLIQIKKHVHFIDGRSGIMKTQQYQSQSHEVNVNVNFNNVNVYDYDYAYDSIKKKVKVDESSFSTPILESGYNFPWNCSAQSFILQKQNKPATLQTYDIKYNTIKKIKSTTLYQSQLYGEHLVKKGKFILQIRIGKLTKNNFNIGIRKSLQLTKFTLSSMIKVVSYQNFLNMQQTIGGNRLNSKDIIKLVVDFTYYQIEILINDIQRYKYSIQDWKNSDCLFYPWIQLCQVDDYVQIIKNRQ